MVAHSNVEDNAAVENRARIELQAPVPVPAPGPPRHREPRHRDTSESQTRFRPFKSEKDFKIITMTTSMLEISGFYWGPMAVEEAHAKLKTEPLGTFLIRDSKQKDYFFTLSVRTDTGPTSIRINFQNSRFSLVGSKESFNCLFKLLEYYIDSPKKSLVKPLRKVKVQPLQELCRKRIIETFGGENVDEIPINSVLKDFLNSFPFRI
ncbi:suppressor of cytokine signaling 1a [Amia ocellicauda]|uniref:suppressor of cytokine signaling 1a n=1 Tax=Amia ocellicauda TaxID=2972642 RepID=UPI003464952A